MKLINKEMNLQSPPTYKAKLIKTFKNSFQRKGKCWRHLNSVTTSKENSHLQNQSILPWPRTRMNFEQRASAFEKEKGTVKRKLGDEKNGDSFCSPFSSNLSDALKFFLKNMFLQVALRIPSSSPSLYWFSPQSYNNKRQHYIKKDFKKKRKEVPVHIVCASRTNSNKFQTKKNWEKCNWLQQGQQSCS